MCKKSCSHFTISQLTGWLFRRLEFCRRIVRIWRVDNIITAT